MRRVSISLPDHIVAGVARFAPGRERTRFIREAILQALWARQDEATAEAYRKHPDSAADECFDPTLWDDPRRER